MNYYQVLEIGSRASTEEIERAFRKLARQVHPDLNSGGSGGAAKAEARMKQLNEIRDTLTDPLLRAGYDERLRLEAERDARVQPRAAPQPPSAHPMRASAAREAGVDDVEPASTPWGRMVLLALGAGAVVTAVMVSLPRHEVSAILPAREAAESEPDALAPPPASATSSPASPGPRPHPSTATAVPAAASRPFRGKVRRRGVVHLGSTADEVLRAFGTPDRIEPGPRAGDAVFVYGRLTLEMQNGRVTGGDAAAR
jgi:curved DNA-binding protein CbpA